MPLKDKGKQFYLVDFNILPEAIKKTIRVKEILHADDNLSVNEAVKEAHISRSAYYKYKDHVASESELQDKSVMVLVLETLNHLSPLNRVLKLLTLSKAQILTVQRNVPIGKIVVITVAFSLPEDGAQISTIESFLGKLKGIKSFKLIKDSKSKYR